MRSRLFLCLFLVFALCVSVVAPASAQPEVEPPPEVDAFDPATAESPPPPADGETHPDAAAAAEQGFDFDGTSLDVEPSSDPGAVVAGPGPTDLTDDGSDMASRNPESSNVPEWAKRGLNNLSEEAAVMPSAVAPGRRVRFEPGTSGESAPATAGLVDDATEEPDEVGALSAIRLVRPDGDSSIGVTLETIDDGTTRELSNAGLAFRMETDRSVGRGRPIVPAPRKGDGGRPSVDIGPRSGWELHIKLDLFVETMHDPTSLQFEVSYGCSPSGKCKAAQDLPTRIDEEAGLAVVELPANVMASLARSGNGNRQDARVEPNTPSTTSTAADDAVGDVTTTTETSTTGQTSTTTTTTSPSTTSETTTTETTTSTTSETTSTTNGSNDDAAGSDESALAVDGLLGVSGVPAGSSFSRGVSLRPALELETADTGILFVAQEGGDRYSASKFESLATWQVGLQTGHAELSYNMPVPEGLGYTPNVSFSYSSGSVDGLNNTTNDQVSKVGVGWSESTAVISRAIMNYSPTSKNLTPVSGNRHDGFSLSFNGVSGPLVRVTTSDTGSTHPQVSGAKFWEYRLQEKNDWRVRRVEALSAGAFNGDAWSTWWEITTGDGTLFTFGREYAFKPTGGSGVATTRPRSTDWSRNLKSLQAVPLYFDDGTRNGVDCGQVDGYCMAGLAWYLDQVVDTSGNQATFQYTTETNRIRTVVNGQTYAQTTAYDRDVALDWIDYGRKFGESPLGWTASFPFRVNFSYEDRKLSNGAWADVPTNLDCTSSTTCSEQTPSFYSKKRMRGVSVYTGNQGNWKYGWALNHSYPQPPDPASADRLWLSNFDRFYYGKTSFEPIFLDNRVNPSGSKKQAARVKQMRTANGGLVTFTYGQSHPPTNNSSDYCYRLSTDGTRRQCDMYPAWDVNPYQSGIVWWHKWKVTKQEVNARWGGSSTMATTFEYKTPPDFAHKATGRTAIGFWNDYRGHRQVDVIDASGVRTSHFFYTGMYDDKNINRSTEPARVKNPKGELKNNVLALRGRSLGTIRYAAPVSGSAPVQYRETIDNSTTNDYSTTRANVPERFLRSTRVTWQRNSQDHYQWPENGSRQTTEQQLHFDWVGRVAKVRDRGLTSTPNDDYTRFTDYKNTSDSWVYSVPTFTGAVSWDSSASTRPATDYMSATAFDVDAFGRTTKRRDQYQQYSVDKSPLYEDTRYKYNSRGQVTEERVVAGSRGGGDKVSYFGYNDTYGYLWWQDGPLAGTVDKYSYQVDPTFGSVTVETDPNHRKTYLTYDKIGRLTSVRAAGAPEVTSKYSYGVSQWGIDWTKTEVLRNRFSSEKFIPTWEFSDGVGRTIQTQERHPSNNSKTVVVSTRYDNVGRLYDVTEPRWASVSSGTFLSENWGSIGAGFHRYTYPASVNTNAGCDRGLNTVVHSYDKNRTWWSKTQTAVCGLESRSWDREYRRTTSFHNARGDVVKSVNSAGETVSFQYNERGDMTRATDNAGNQTEYQYWSWNADGPRKVVDPNRGSTEYGYDRHGRVRETKDARGTRLIYGYDAADRPTNIWFGHSSGSLDVSRWRYDNGYGNYGTLAQSEHWNRTTDGVSNGFVSDKFTYDDRYRATHVDQKITGQDWKRTSYTYLETGAVEDVVHPDGKTVKNRFDRMGRVSWVGIDDHTAAEWVSYNERGQVGGIQRGVSGWHNDLKTLYQYDHRNGRLAKATTTGRTGPVQDFEYKYRRNGELSSLKETGPGGTTTTCSTHDSAKRLTKAWTRVDGNCGNTSSDGSGFEPFEVAYSYNGLGNITRATGTGTVNGNYSYSSGHVNAASAAGGSTYSYDAAGNRTKAVVGGKATDSRYDVQNRLISTSGAATSQNLYRASGERARRMVNGSSSWYYRDGFELDSGSGGTVSMSVAGMLVAARGADRELWSQAADHLGTPSVSVSWSGNVETRRNTPFGGLRSGLSSVAGGPSDLSFTGQRDDVGTGLMYFGARFYDPVLGQFTQPDSLSVDGLNRYAYVRNSPLSLVDPSGLCAEEVADSGGCYQWGLLEIGWSTRAQFGDSRNWANQAYGLASSRSPDPVTVELASAGFGAAAATTAAKVTAPLWKRAFNAAKNVFKRPSRSTDRFGRNASTGHKVAPNGLADDFANHGSEFLDDATRFPTSRLDTGAGTFDVPPHAANRMAQRGITNGNVQDALTTQPFDYFHDGIWKVGYYDTGTRVFVGTVGETITTTIKTGPNYIRNIQAATP